MKRARCLVTGLVLALSPSLACKDEAPQLPDAALRERELTMLEHTRAMSKRMRDVRFRAELTAELAVAEHKRAGGPSTRLETELLAEAVDALKVITSEEDRDVAAVRVALAHVAAGAFDTALDIASSVRAVEQRSSVLVRIAEAAAAAGFWERAAQIADRIVPAEPKGEALVAAASGAAKAQKFEEAWALAKRCTGTARAAAYAGIARAHVAKNNYKVAQQIADSIESGHYKSDVYAAIALQYFTTKNRERAETTARGIESSWLQARAYGEMAKLAFRGGEKRRAEVLFDKATGIVTGINDAVMKAAALEDLAALGLELDKARAVADMPNLTPTKDARNRIFAKLAEHAAGKGDFEGAKMHADLITGDPISIADALGAIAIAKANAGDDAGALEVVEAIPSLQLRVGPAARVVISAEAGARAVSSATLGRLATVLEVQQR